MCSHLSPKETTPKEIEWLHIVIDLNKYYFRTFNHSFLPINILIIDLVLLLNSLIIKYEYKLIVVAYLYIKLT